MRSRLRIGLVLVAAAGLFGVGAGAVVARQERPAEPVWSHVVRPGETLWELARRAAPERDPREVVDLLIRANRLDGGRILAGRRLVLPAR